MGTAVIAAWNTAWRGWWKRSDSQSRDCVHIQGLWRILRRRRQGVILDGMRYCVDGCLESALGAALRRVRSVSQHTTPHRIPLGLQLLSRQLITAEQLRSALQAQRTNGYGRIGEWLQDLGFANQEQVTAALARQWSCPVLRGNLLHQHSTSQSQVPLTILEQFMMLQIDYVVSSATIYVAFSEGVDYSVLYAIEQMTGCHTESCMTTPSLVRATLQELASHRAENEVVFEHVSDYTEVSRIIRSYCVRLDASEIRIARCGTYFWVRLLGFRQCPYDLLMRSPQSRTSTVAASAGALLVS